jgi:anti-sigma regulatory factor (Ser/Thr protein kinase)
MSGADSAIRIPGGRRAGLEARAALTAKLDGRVNQDELRDVHLLASEVVNNSVVHGGVDEDGWIELLVAADAQRVRVAVRDSGSNGDPTPREPDLEHGGGFGLFLVETMASRWGTNHEADLTVWFELDLNG